MTGFGRTDANVGRWLLAERPTCRQPPLPMPHSEGGTEDRQPHASAPIAGPSVLPSHTGEPVVNGFLVRAIGWVLRTNMFILTRAEAHELADL